MVCLFRSLLYTFGQNLLDAVSEREFASGFQALRGSGIPIRDAGRRIKVFVIKDRSAFECGLGVPEKEVNQGCIVIADLMPGIADDQSEYGVAVDCGTLRELLSIPFTINQCEGTTLLLRTRYLHVSLAVSSL